MFTSDKDTIIIDSYEILEEESGHTKARRNNNEALPGALSTALIYLAIAIGLMIFGAVYEYFGHGVYSYFMIYAFAIPLIFGMVPYMMSYLAELRGTSKNTLAAKMISPSGTVAAGMYHAAIATFTLGSIMKGVLDIYGTTNRLTIVYPVLGVILIAASILIRVKEKGSNNHSYRAAKQPA